MTSNYGDYELNKRIADVFSKKTKKAYIKAKSLLKMSLKYFRLLAKDIDLAEKYSDEHLMLEKHLHFIWNQMAIFNNNVYADNNINKTLDEKLEEFIRDYFYTNFENYLNKLLKK